MKMKALKTFRQSSTGKIVNQGDDFDEPNSGRAQHYEREGMAYEVIALPAPIAARAATVKTPPARKNEAAAAGPLPAAGGETGAASAASSSPADPAPPAPASTPPAADAASSPSTKAAASRRSRTSSTAPTAPGGEKSKVRRSSKASS